jgi:hypothetical protein
MNNGPFLTLHKPYKPPGANKIEEEEKELAPLKLSGEDEFLEVKHHSAKLGEKVARVDEMVAAARNEGTKNSVNNIRSRAQNRRHALGSKDPTQTRLNFNRDPESQQQGGKKRTKKGKKAKKNKSRNTNKSASRRSTKRHTKRQTKRHPKKNAKRQTKKH